MDVNLPKLANKLAPYLSALLKGTSTTVPAFPNAIDLPEIATPSTPASGYGRLYGNSDGLLHYLNDAGAEYQAVPSAVSTYTPTYTGASTAGSTTYSVQIGHYARIGPLCWFSARVDWTAASGTGVAQISLPVQAKNTSNFAQTLSVYASNVTFAASGLIAVINPGATVAFVASPTSNGATASSTVEAAGLIILTGIYEVN